MLPKDFRGYLDYLEKQGKLLRVKKEVAPKFETRVGEWLVGYLLPKNSPL